MSDESGFEERKQGLKATGAGQKKLLSTFGKKNRMYDVVLKKVNIVSQKQPFIIRNFNKKEFVVYGGEGKLDNEYKRLNMRYNPEILIQGGANKITIPGWIGPKSSLKPLRQLLNDKKVPHKFVSRFDIIKQLKPNTETVQSTEKTNYKNWIYKKASELTDDEIAQYEAIAARDGLKNWAVAFERDIRHEYKPEIRIARDMTHYSKWLAKKRNKLTQTEIQQYKAISNRDGLKSWVVAFERNVRPEYTGAIEAKVFRKKIHKFDEPDLFNPNQTKVDIDSIRQMYVEDMDPKLRKIAIDYLYKTILSVMSSVDLTEAEFTKNWIDSHLKAKQSYSSYIKKEYNNWSDGIIAQEAINQISAVYEEMIDEALAKINHMSVEHVIHKLVKSYPNLFAGTAREAAYIISTSNTRKPLYVYIYNRLTQVNHDLYGFNLISYVGNCIETYYQSLGDKTFGHVFDRIYNKRLNKLKSQIKRPSQASFVRKYGKELLRLYKEYEREYEADKEALTEEVPVTYQNRLDQIEMYKNKLSSLKPDLEVNEQHIYDSMKQMTVTEYMHYLLLPTAFLGNNPVSYKSLWAHKKTAAHYINPRYLYSNTIVNYFPEFAVLLAEGRIDDESRDIVFNEIENVLSGTEDLVISTYLSIKYPGYVPIVPEYGMDLIDWRNVLSYEWIIQAEKMQIQPEQIKICYKNDKIFYSS